MSQESNSDKPIEAQIVSEQPAPAPIPEKPKRRPARNTAFKKLPLRQQKFVMEYIQNPTNSATAAVKAAGYRNKTDQLARIRGVRLLESHKVQNALQEKIREMYPNVEEKLARQLQQLADLPLKLTKEDVGATVTEKLAILDKFIKIFGFEAPKKVQSLQAKVNLLPKQD